MNREQARDRGCPDPIHREAILRLPAKIGQKAAN